jgi:O-antigen/teichoic acid export membrane protein
VTAAAELSQTPGAALAQAQRAALSVFLIRIGGAALAYLTQILLARLMGKAEYGIYATVWVWITVLGHGSLWGLSHATCRFVPHYRARGEADLARGFLAGGAVFTVVSGLLVAVLGAAVLFLGRSWIGEAYMWPLAVAVLVVPLFALQDYVEAVARSFNWVGLAIAPPYLLRQGALAAAMVGGVVLGAPAEAWVAIACTLAATTLALAVQTAAVLRRLVRVLPPARRAYKGRDWVIAALPLAMVDLALTGFNFLDVLLMSFLLSPEAVAVYFAATRILQFVNFIPYAATAATAARFAEAKARGNVAELRALVVRTARLMSLATLVAGTAVLLAAPVLLRLFGPGFEASFGPLLVLVMGVAAYAAFGPAEDLLNMLGGERLSATVAFVSLCSAGLLIFLLVPAYGIMGAAIAMALANVVRGAGLCLMARARLGISTHVMSRAG